LAEHSEVTNPRTAPETEPAGHLINPAEPNNQHPVVPRLRFLAPWLATGGLMAGGVASFGLILRVFYANPALFARLLETQVRAIVGIPMAAASSFCVFWVLEATSGGIQFEVIGFKFRGASGPVVLWVMSFLAFVAAIRVLWM
jgi:hypothetical protein